ncbi:MAG: FAD-dependent oxidoreductase, partial [Chloroflexi bacterium]|nr:FAD-dependent oxidoreductase [Chloroflexota bacterium]
TAELQLQAADVATDTDGRVLVDEYLRTSQPHIFAAGDVCSPLLYTHVATYEGNLAGENLFAREPRRVDRRGVPRITFTDPEIASVGMSEAAAQAEVRDVRVACAPIHGLGKALVDSTNVGLIKLVADAHTGELLGGHLVAPSAGELIHQIVIALRLRANVRDVADAIHAYPSFADGFKVAAGEWLAGA